MRGWRELRLGADFFANTRALLDVRVHWGHIGTESHCVPFVRTR